MSLEIVINGPEGVVLAAESRVTLGANVGGQSIGETLRQRRPSSDRLRRGPVSTLLTCE